MFSKLKEFIQKHYVITLGVALLLYLMYNTVNAVVNPPELQNFKGGIQNHLIWSIKGECYFVRPYTNNTTYLIRVEDCDKK